MGRIKNIKLHIVTDIKSYILSVDRMPYNIRSRNRQDQLPKEVWLHIFSFLKADPTPFDWQMYHYNKPTNYNFTTLKQVSLVSKRFNEWAKQLIWKFPRLKQPLSLKQ